MSSKIQKISKGRTSKSLFSDIATNPRKKKIVGISLLVIASSAIWLPMVINYILTGSFVGLPPIEEEDVQYHIGYYTVDSIGWNSSRKYVDVNITGDLLNYYTMELVESNVKYTNNDEIYYVSNVTILYVTEVESIEGLLYPNKTFLIYATMNQTNPTNNPFTFMPYPSSVDAEIINIDGTYGIFTLGDIPNDNFTMILALNNPTNATIGELNFIPNQYRQYENISNSAFWCKLDCIIYSVNMNGYVQDVYYDDVGNSYFILQYINYLQSVTITLDFDTDAIPTAIDLIYGQWNDLPLASL